MDRRARRRCDFTRVVPPRTRVTLWLDREVSDEGVALAGQDGMSVELTAAAGFVAERAMWWPGESADLVRGARRRPASAKRQRSSWRLAGR